jgi:hypothetical protein
MFTAGANERLSIPFGIDFPEWKFLVAHLLQKRAQSSPVSAREIAGAAGLD